MTSEYGWKSQQKHFSILKPFEDYPTQSIALCSHKISIIQSNTKLFFDEADTVQVSRERTTKMLQFSFTHAYKPNSIPNFPNRKESRFQPPSSVGNFLFLSIFHSYHKRLGRNQYTISFSRRICSWLA